ncbi:metal-dependent hydrolase [Metabacillus herbersteinensis]|uniref:Metal-dependent hydrolase n=1 Tax=Metabacillus herbersteinensis TaxID=283816 RepID=A0ABV6GDE6_9BACI
MDTSTHVAMGFGLAGLAYLDPAVSSNSELANAVLLGTVIGSNAPDFDYVIKLVKGNGLYIEHHRGASHSIPALFLWTIFLSGILYLFSVSVPILPLMYWTFLAVSLHVLFDVFNAYGTQAGKPFTKKWLSLNFIPLFDPFIMLLHLVGFGGWLISGKPGPVFLIVYGVIICYLFERLISSRKIAKLVKFHMIDQVGKVTIIPTIFWNNWDVVFETANSYQIGRVKQKKVIWIHKFGKHYSPSSVIDAARKDKDVRHFLAVSSHTHVVVISSRTGYEVRFSDVRFRSKNHYPFMAVVKLNSDYEVLSSYTGWIHQPTQLNEKLSSQKQIST